MAAHCRRTTLRAPARLEPCVGPNKAEGSDALRNRSRQGRWIRADGVTRPIPAGQPQCSGARRTLHASEVSAAFPPPSGTGNPATSLVRRRLTRLSRSATSESPRAHVIEAVEIQTILSSPPKRRPRTAEAPQQYWRLISCPAPPQIPCLQLPRSKFTAYWLPSHREWLPLRFLISTLAHPRGIFREETRDEEHAPPRHSTREDTTRKRGRQQQGGKRAVVDWLTIENTGGRVRFGSEEVWHQDRLSRGNAPRRRHVEAGRCGGSAASSLDHLEVIERQQEYLSGKGRVSASLLRHREIGKPIV